MAGAASRQILHGLCHPIFGYWDGCGGLGAERSVGLERGVVGRFFTLGVGVVRWERWAWALRTGGFLPIKSIVMVVNHTLRIAGIARWVAGFGLAVGLLAGASGCANGSLDPAGALASVFPAPPSPTEAVNMMFDRDDPDNRREGINWLSASPFGGEDEYVRSYRLFYSDPDPSVRAACAQALGLHGNVEDANLLIIMLSDDNAQVRWNAANGLRMIHLVAAAEPLAKRTNDLTETDVDVRQAACDALGQYADVAVYNALSRALEDRNYAVVEAARRSLITLTGHDAGDDPRDWADWAQTQGSDLFVNQQVYTYAPYQKPRGWTDSMFFWREREEGKPQQPLGIEVAEG